MPNQSVIEGTITANGGAVGPFQFRDGGRNRSGRIQIIGTGTFTGTLQVRVCPVGEAAADGAPDPTSYTAPFSVVVSPGGDCDVYVYASTWTSGTANITVTS